MDKKLLGKFIKKRRKELHITQNEFAERLNVIAGTVSKWENGRSYPDIELLEPIADILQVPIERLFEESRKEKNRINISSVVSIIVLVSLSLAGIIFVNIKSHRSISKGTYIDYNYMFREGTGVVSMTAAEKGYYFAMNNVLYYADSDTMKIVPVCSKIDCLHEAKPQCDAYIGESLSWFGYVQYYDGYVYTVSDMGMKDSNYYLWRISTDGTKKEKILKINSLDNVVMHHGYIFYIECIYDIDGGPNEQIIYKVNLSDNKKENVYKTSGELYDMAAYRDYVYFTVSESEDAGVYAYNIKNDSIIKAEMPEGAVDMRSIQFMNDKLIFTYWYASGDERNCRIYSSNLDFKNRKELFRMKNPDNRIGCDNRYIYEDNYMNKDVYLNNLSDRSMTIYDINGNLIDSVDIGNTGTYCSGYGDDNYVFVRTEESIYYFDKKEIGTGNIQVKTLRG